MCRLLGQQRRPLLPWLRVLLLIAPLPLANCLSALEARAWSGPPLCLLLGRRSRQQVDGWLHRPEVLAQAFRQLLRERGTREWGPLVARNVATLVDPPRVRRVEIRPLNLEQARALLEAVRGDRLEALYAVALAVGLRQGEALGLDWSDIDLEIGTLRVRQTLQRVAGKLQLGEAKTERSHRTLHLPGFAVEARRVHKIRQLEERLQAGPLWHDRGLVFTTRTGGPIAKENFRRPCARLLTRSGLPAIRFHDLRHTCASLLRAQGADARLIMEILGNSQISTTLDVYTHLFQPAGKDAAGRMDDALSPKPRADSQAADS